MEVQTLKVLVVGDKMRDFYHFANVRGISQEKPIPIYDVYSVQHLPGGAGNLCSNLQTLGCETRIVFGLDSYGQIPVKNRILVNQEQVVRFDQYDKVHPVLLRDVPVEKYSCVCVADYGKGSVDELVASTLLLRGAKLYVHTKQSPKMWLGAKPENRPIMFCNGLEYAKYLDLYDSFPFVVRTLGAAGLELVEYGDVNHISEALSDHVVDVNGCGDSTMAGFVLSHMSGNSLQLSCEIASHCAAIAVEQPLTYSVKRGELLESVQSDELLQDVNL